MSKQQDYLVRNSGIDKQSLENINHFALRNMPRPWLAFLGQRNYKFIEAEEGSRILHVI